MDLHDQSDGELLGAFVERKDEAAFQALADRHARMVYKVCRRILGNHHDAEEAVQAAFLVLALKGASLTPKNSVSAFLHWVACCVARDLRSARETRRNHERKAGQTFGPKEPREGGEEGLQSEVVEALAQLPEKFRLPLVLFHLEGLGIQEIASLLREKPGIIGVRLARGREKLRRRLKRGGIVLSLEEISQLLHAKDPMEFSDGIFSLPSARWASLVLSQVSMEAGKPSEVSRLAAAAVQRIATKTFRNRCMGTCAGAFGLLAVFLLLVSLGLPGWFGPTLQEPPPDAHKPPLSAGERDGPVLHPRPTARSTQFLSRIFSVPVNFVEPLNYQMVMGILKFEDEEFLAMLPGLLENLADKTKDPGRRFFALNSLELLAGQSLGRPSEGQGRMGTEEANRAWEAWDTTQRTDAWKAWWERFQGRPRMEWLVEARQSLGGKLDAGYQDSAQEGPALTGLDILGYTHDRGAAPAVLESLRRHAERAGRRLDHLDPFPQDLMKKAFLTLGNLTEKDIVPVLVDLARAHNSPKVQYHSGILSALATLLGWKTGLYRLSFLVSTPYTYELNGVTIRKPSQVLDETSLERCLDAIPGKAPSTPNT